MSDSKLKAVAFNNSRLIDRFGRRLEIGSQITYKSPVDLLFAIVDIRPILDRRVQAGMHEIKLTCEVTIPAMDRVPVDLAILIAAPRPLDAAADNGNQDHSTLAAVTAPDAEDPAAPAPPAPPPALDDEP